VEAAFSVSALEGFLVRLPAAACIEPILGSLQEAMSG
jgi:hypothetical protein